MRILQFTVYGCPIAQPRTKAQAFINKATGKAFAHVYEPGKKDSPARQWKADVKQTAVLHRPEQPFDGPVRVDIGFYMPRPQKYMRAKDPEGPFPHIVKPDRDNLEKNALDAMKGIVFRDDCQVCAGEIRKLYCGKTESPRAEITVTNLVQEDR